MTTKIDEMIIQARSNGLSDLADALEEKRSSLGDNASEDEIEAAIRETVIGNLGGMLAGLGEDEDPEFMEKSIDAVKKIFDEEGWHYECRHPGDGVAVFELGFNIPVNGKPTSVPVRVYIEGIPKTCRIFATLRYTVEDAYLYPFTKMLTKVNYPKRFGGFTFDESDGELGYNYCYPIGHGVYKDDFMKVFRAVLRAAADDDVIPEIRKAASGRFKNREKNEILSQINALIEELTD